MTLPIKLRAVEASDIDFLISSWTKSYRQSYFAQKIPNDVYFDEHKKVIAKRFQDSTALVATPQDERDQICGYVVFNPTKHHAQRLLLHYIYVKQPFRRLGVGSALLSAALAEAAAPEGAMLVVTHTSANFTHFYPGKVSYNPYILL